MTVLVADDDKSILTALKLLLSSENLDAILCSTPGDALEQIRNHSFQLALIDLNYQEDTTSGQEGLKLIIAIREIDANLPIIVMTGWGTVSIAVEAMKRGATDFVEKPWDDNNRLVTAIRNQIHMGEIARSEIRLRTENQILKKEREDTNQMVCESPVMKRLMQTVEKVAQSNIPILITGENGTGKSLLAKCIHEKSLRGAGPFVSVNMGGISESIFESEMFGHIKGAFTDATSDRIGRVELAEGGTLFMDEIANMPRSQQPKILKLLEEFKYERLGSSQTRKASVRVISATNANIELLIQEQGFRQDLLYRLNGITLNLPPLRERTEDIIPLAERFLRQALNHYDSPATRFSKAALLQLTSYSWPGNVRELQHVVERAVLLSVNKEIGEKDLQLSNSAKQVGLEIPEEFFRMSLDEAQVWYIQKVIETHQGNSTKAAESLGISRSALYRRLEKK
ncbi:MAG: sigma-54 dependent transcriptional regulator [Gammaproteobacteria bacterium]|nr:sigma-54 dependent transcriptional regulator [Gammaproteobacteria bacterium]